MTLARACYLHDIWQNSVKQSRLHVPVWKVNDVKQFAVLAFPWQVRNRIYGKKMDFNTGALHIFCEIKKIIFFFKRTRKRNLQSWLVLGAVGILPSLLTIKEVFLRSFFLLFAMTESLDRHPSFRRSTRDEQKSKTMQKNAFTLLPFTRALDLRWR